MNQWYVSGLKEGKKSKDRGKDLMTFVNCIDSFGYFDCIRIHTLLCSRLSPDTSSFYLGL